MNSRWITDLTVRPAIIKLPGETTGENLSDFELGKRFLRHDTKTTSSKRKKILSLTRGLPLRLPTDFSAHIGKPEESGMIQSMYWKKKKNANQEYYISQRTLYVLQKWRCDKDFPSQKSWGNILPLDLCYKKFWILQAKIKRS